MLLAVLNCTVESGAQHLEFSMAMLVTSATGLRKYAQDSAIMPVLVRETSRHDCPIDYKTDSILLLSAHFVYET